MSGNLRGAWSSLRKVAAAMLLPPLFAMPAPARADEAPRALPAPAMTSPTSPATVETAVLAGGCFWGMQGLYQHVKGVSKVLAGYSGG